MRFKEYLDSTNQKPVPWAKQNGFSEATIWRIYTGKGRASSELALKIEQTTKGMVSRMDILYPEE